MISVSSVSLLNNFIHSKFFATAVILFVAVCFHILPNHLTTELNFHQELITNGQWWRIITGHFAHTNTMHLLMNSAALVLFSSIHGQYFNKIQLFSMLFLLCLLTSIGIYFLSPNLTDYVGLSGVLHGLFVIGAIKDIQVKEKTGYILITGLVLKLIYEQFFGASDDVAKLINARVAIDAHLWGALAGALITPLFIKK